MILSLPLARLTAITLTLSLVFASLLLTSPVHGADPGEAIFSFSGPLGTSSAAARTLNLNTSGPANLSLSVGGGVAGDSVVLTLLDSSNTALSPTWSAHQGETIWIAATLPAGGKIRLSTDATSLNVELKGYVRGSVTAPTEDGPSLAGRLIGAGQSTSATGFTLTVPTAGLYRLSLEASSGAYQIVIGETVRKTVTAAPASPAPDDSTYFLAAGSQNFQIIPDASTGVVTAWSIQITSVGGNDSLPYREASGALGGATFAGGSFTTELVPLQLAADAEVNVSIAVQGDANNGLTVELLNGATEAYASGSIKGGETLWFTSQLTAGANALRVVAPAGNSGPLSYTIELRGLAAPDLTLSGSSQGASALNSTVRVSFPTAGLYNFTLGASAGRYQLRLNDTFLRRIVTTEGSIFTAFVPAGTHELVVVQASSGAAWSVVIAGTNQTSDTLPFSRSGVTLGDQFNEEWLPIALAEAGQVNIRLTASGANPDDRDCRLIIWYR